MFHILVPIKASYWFFPTLTCGVFVFSAVSAPSFSSSSRLPSQKSSHTHTHITHSHIHHTHAHTHTSLTHSQTWLPVAFAWQARDLVHCQGVGCTPRCPSGVPCRSAALPVAFAWQGVGQCALPRAWLYAPLALRLHFAAVLLLWLPLFSRMFPSCCSGASFHASPTLIRHTLHYLHSTLYTLHSSLHTPHTTLYTLHSILYTLHSTLYLLYTPHSTIYTLQTPHA